MTHTIQPSNYVLHSLLRNIHSYEPNIYNTIMRSLFYPIKDSDELREVVKQRIYSDNQIWAYRKLEYFKVINVF